MKKKFFTKFLMVIAMLFGLVVTGGNLAVNAAETTVTTTVSDYASAKGWSDATKYTSLVMDNYITITVSGGSNTGKYYTNGNNWRMYQNESPEITVNADGGRTLTSIKFTYSVNNGGCMTYNGGNISSGTVVDVSGLSSATFGVGNTGTKTNGQARITEIQVVYDSPSSSEHTCDFDQEKVDDKYKVSDADCENAAVYYKSCTCGVAGTETFESGEALGHNYSNLGICERCDAVETSVLTSLKLVLNKYYNDNQYLKETVLNVKDKTIEEAEKHFHASASVRERETWYYGDSENGTSKLTMITYEDKDGKDGDTLVTSTYENGNGNVNHTGKGGNWSVNWNNVEEKFVTLKDFIDSEDANWTYANNVFTYELVETTALGEHEMTRMAREFVAPMWISDYAYLRFTKLTVEEESGKGLVMRLYVNTSEYSEKEEEGKITDSTGVFAQATINEVHNITISTDENCEILDEVSVIAENHIRIYNVSVSDGYQLVNPTATKAKAILNGENGLQVSNATGDVTVELTTEVETSEKEVTLSFADTSTRDSWNTSQQTWSTGDVKLVNNKTSASSNVADNSNPARFYKDSTLTITANGGLITKIVFNVSSSYKGLDAGSFEGYTVSISGNVVTVTLTTPADAFTISLSASQMRCSSMVVTYTE